MAECEKDSVKTIRINVSGTTFIVNPDVINKNIDSPLVSLSRESPYYDVTNDAFCFSRDPDVFYSVLNFYRYGELHLPRSLCSNVMRKELEFWGVKENMVSSCCLSLLSQAKVPKPHPIEDKCARPDSNRSSMIWNSLYICVSLLHTCVFMIWNEKVVRVSPNVAKSEPAPIDSSDNNLARFVRMDPALILFAVSIICNIFFTGELIICFIVCPMKKKFIRSFWNILNIILTLDFWFVILVEACIDLDNQNEHFQKFVLFCTGVNTIRLVTIFRHPKQNSVVNDLLFVIRHSLGGFLELLLIYIVGVVVFGSLIYYAETARQEFQSDIWSTLLRAVSMGTFGQGENHAHSLLGKLISAVFVLYNMIVFAATLVFLISEYRRAHVLYNDKVARAKCH